MSKDTSGHSIRPLVPGLGFLASLEVNEVAARTVVGGPVRGHGLGRVRLVDARESEIGEEIDPVCGNGGEDRPALVVHRRLDQLLGDGFVPEGPGGTAAKQLIPAAVNNKGGT